MLSAGIGEGNAGPVRLIEMCESIGELLLDVARVMLGYCLFDGFEDRFAVELLRVAKVNRKEDFLDKSKTLQVVELSALVDQSSEAEMQDIADCIIILLLDLQP